MCIFSLMLSLLLVVAPCIAEARRTTNYDFSSYSERETVRCIETLINKHENNLRKKKRNFGRCYRTAWKKAYYKGKKGYRVRIASSEDHAWCEWLKDGRWVPYNRLGKEPIKYTYITF